MKQKIIIRKILTAQLIVTTSTILLLLLMIFIYLALFGYSDDWTGFKEYPAVSTENKPYQPPKRLWDWMSLLIVPSVLALGGLLFNQSQNARNDRNNKDENREMELQNYIDKVSELLLKHDLRGSHRDSEVRDIVRARTLVVLRRLDPKRMGFVLSFLQSSDLIGRDEEKNIVDLRKTDLREIDLAGQDLSFVSLINVFLQNSDLTGCTMIGSDLRNSIMENCNLFTADLSSSDLSRTKLNKANLSSVNLERSDLSETDLRRANLQGAILIQTDLRKADLRGADLTDAVLTDADLRETKYNRKTKLPRGFAIPKEMILSE